MKPVLAERFGQTRGLAMDALRDSLKPFGTMEYSVETSHDGKQCLRGTHIRRRLFTANVLLAGLKRQAVGAVAVAVDGHAHNTPRHVARISLLGRHIGRVWSAVTDRHAKTLGRTDSNVSPHRARFFEQSQCHRVRGDDADRFGVVELGDVVSEVAQVAVRARILENSTEDLARIHFIGFADCDLDPERCRAGFHHGDVLRMTPFVNEKALHFGLGHALRHCHRFRTSGCFVEQGRVGNL